MSDLVKRLRGAHAYADGCRYAWLEWEDEA